ncbi:hypothetical protein Q0Z83_044700 [Actinoplanes sichuanensis]|nr:hypothetical protein Q0Z83_044700 [Actinoplanes sichuanensis]
MLTLDVTIVSVALAGIQDELAASLSSLQWVVDGYTLPLACGLLSAAVLGDRIGRRRVFVAGMLVFTAASLACALADTAATLIAARAVQGGERPCCSAPRCRCSARPIPNRPGGHGRSACSAPAMPPRPPPGRSSAVYSSTGPAGAGSS